MSQPGLPPIPRTSIHQIGPSFSRRWQLHFINKFPHTLFTGNKIEGANGEPVQIVTMDAVSKRVVTSGPLSSVKVQISVLDGDFGSDENESWSKEEFEASVILQRKGKRPLVAGDLQIILVDGVGYLGDAIFTDNSSWMRSRKFRLGARVAGGRCTYEEIREARSEAFMVKDHRGEGVVTPLVYKKHHPPFLCDQVWRLEKIGKDGAFHNRLSSHQINNVRDFLRFLFTKPSCLRDILGSGMSSKIWDTIVQHAMSCNMDNKRYMYHNSEQQFGLVFDSVYWLVGITFDRKCVKLLENLTQSQMNLVESLKHHAYRNLDQMTEIDWPLVDSSSVIPPLEGSSFSGPVLDPPPSEMSITFKVMENPIDTLDQNLEALATQIVVLKFCSSRVVRKDPKRMEGWLESTQSAMTDFVEIRREWNKLKGDHFNNLKTRDALNCRVIDSLKGAIALKKVVQAIMETLSNEVKTGEPKQEAATHSKKRERDVLNRGNPSQKG